MANMNFNPTWNSNSFSPYSNPYYNQNFRSYQSQLNTQQQQQQFYPNTSTGQNNIFWVEGKENARSMQLQPNSTMLLMDSEVGKFYIKTTDDIGLGKLRVFSYIEEPDNDSSTNSSSVPNVDLSNYVTKAELE